MYIAPDDKRNPKIINENPNGSGQIEYTRFTSTGRFRKIIDITAAEMKRIKKAIASGNEDNIDSMFYDIE